MLPPYQLHHPHYQRGIKRDFNVFPTLKDEKNNDQCHCMFTNMAQAQDLSDVLNPKYVPHTTTAYNFFWEKQKFLWEKQKFLYAVLTAKGKPIKHQYKSMDDAQKAYEKLEQHHLTSNSACLLLIRLWNTSRLYVSMTGHFMVV
jgi:hypothetical protein